MTILVRIGVVSTVDEATGTARVSFSDGSNRVSYELHVLKNAWPVQPTERVACILLHTGAEGFIVGSYYTKDDPPPPMEVVSLG